MNKPYKRKFNFKTFIHRNESKNIKSNLDTLLKRLKRTSRLNPFRKSTEIKTTQKIPIRKTKNNQIDKNLTVIYMRKAENVGERSSVHFQRTMRKRRTLFPIIMRFVRIFQKFPSFFSTRILYVIHHWFAPSLWRPLFGQLTFRSRFSTSRTRHKANSNLAQWRFCSNVIKNWAKLRLGCYFIICAIDRGSSI